MRTSKKIRKENDLLIEKAQYTGEIDNPTEIRLISYNGTSFRKERLEDNTLPDLSDKDSIHWIKVNGLLDTVWINSITHALNIPQMVLQDILQPQIIPRIEVYDDLIECCLKYHTITEKRRITTEQVTVIMGKNFIISFQETDNPIFDDIIEGIEFNKAHLRTHSLDYLFLLLLNHVLAIYINQMNKLEDTYEVMENELLDSYNTEDDFRIRLKGERRIYQTMKQSIMPLKDGFPKIHENECGLFLKKNSIYVNAVHEQLKYLLQSIELCRETFDSLVNLYISNNDLRMNEIMKRLTVISAIFIPLTFLVGVWGMNYEFMPELKLKFGYMIAWIIMLTIALSAWLFMRKRRWY